MGRKRTLRACICACESCVLRDELLEFGFEELNKLIEERDELGV